MPLAVRLAGETLPAVCALERAGLLQVLLDMFSYGVYLSRNEVLADETEHLAAVPVRRELRRVLLVVEDPDKLVELVWTLLVY